MMIVSCGQKCHTHRTFISRFQTGFRQNPYHLKCNRPSTLDLLHINKPYLNRSCKRRPKLADTLVSSSSAGFDDKNCEQNQRVQVDLQLPRRRKLVSFTCNLCGMSSLRVMPMHVYIACYHHKSHQHEKTYRSKDRKTGEPYCVGKRPSHCPV